MTRHVDELRAEAPTGTLRLSRVTQDGPRSELDVGWLVEVALADGEPPLNSRRLADALRDMRLLGLERTLLAPPAATPIDAVA